MKGHRAAGDRDKVHGNAGKVMNWDLGEQLAKVTLGMTRGDTGGLRRYTDFVYVSVLAPNRAE